MRMTRTQKMFRYPTLAAIAFWVAGTVAGLGCSPDDPLDFPTNPDNTDCNVVQTTYEGFGKGFFQQYCLRCHSVTLENDLQRLDAPLGINFDTLEMARVFDHRIRLRAGVLGDMPPRLLFGPTPSDEERITLLQWIDCGMQSETELDGE
jgi:uncharacterized membrane protein